MTCLEQACSQYEDFRTGSGCKVIGIGMHPATAKNLMYDLTEEHGLLPGDIKFLNSLFGLPVHTKPECKIDVLSFRLGV